MAHRQRVPPGTTSSLCGATWTGSDYGPAVCAGSLQAPLVYTVGAAAYDPVNRDVLVTVAEEQWLGCGNCGYGFVEAQTWAFDGQAWTRLQPAHEPDVGTAETAVNDDATNQVVMTEPDGATTWVWDGSDWHRVVAGNSPEATVSIVRNDYTSLTYDPTSGSVLQYAQPQSGTPQDEASRHLLRWDGSAWREVIATGLAPAAGAIAYDPQVASVVLHGATPLRSGSPFQQDATSSTTWTLHWKTLP